MTEVATRPTAIRRAEPVMGTVVSFDVRSGEVPAGPIYIALAEARAGLHRADAIFSTWKPHSPMSRLRRGDIELSDAPAVIAEVLARCDSARRASNGWFDPWRMPRGVDPTGLVKGWAAQEALARVVEGGASAVMVNAGGDVAIAGEPEPGRCWRIGIRDPWDANRIAAVVEPQGGGTGRAAVATSGSYERGPHVIDPHTGVPTAGAASATVTGPELDLADALATGLLAAGDAGLEWVDACTGYEALVIRPDGSRTYTTGFPLVP